PKLLPMVLAKLPGGIALPTATNAGRATAGSSSHRPLGFGSRAAFVCHRTAAGEALAISIPRTEASVVRHFQERITMRLSSARHHAAVQMIDTSIVRVHQHAACLATPLPLLSKP